MGWGTDKEFLLIVAFLYFVPFLRLVCTALCLKNQGFLFLNKCFGIFEHATSWFRDSIVILYIVYFASWNFYFEFPEYIILAVLALLFIPLSFANYIWKRNARRRLLEFVKNFPTIHPAEFFRYIFCASGIIAQNFPAGPDTVNPHHLDFRFARKRCPNFARILLGVWSTMWITKLCHMAFKWKGKEFLKEVASSLAVVWGSRMAELANAEVVIEDTEHISDLSGLNIYVYNHLSFLDFAVVPLLTVDLPLFLVAKNHFLDNPLFYRVLGIGRVAKELGMIFVDRKGREPAARLATEEGVEKLICNGVDLAIFPQGTRAYPRFGANRERIDGGYYAVGNLSRLKQDGGHLKKGAAYTAVGTARALAEKKMTTPVNIIPVAIKGSGVVASRGSIRIQPNCTIKLKVGEPIIINPAEVESLSDEKEYLHFVKRIHVRMDNILKSTVMIHADLERRFFEDMRTLTTTLEQEEMSVAMKPWRGDDYLVHSILDLIYTCRQKHWRPFLGRLIYLILNNAERYELLKFKAEIAEKM